MRICLFVLLASLSACASSIPVRLVNDIEIPAEDIDQMLAEAGDILGLTIETVPESYGAILLDVHEARGRIGGRALIRTGCLRAVWARPDATIIAHELAHALGLEHVNVDGNLMHPSANGTALTEEQRDRLELGAFGIGACR